MRALFPRGMMKLRVWLEGIGVTKRSKVSSGPVPDAWGRIAAQRKTFSTWPSWSEIASRPAPDKASTDRDRLRTSMAETTQLIVPLADEKGVGLEGVRLRITAWAYRREEDVTATLEVAGNRAGVTIARVDAWPSVPHMNLPKRRLPAALKHLPAEVAGHHVHRFVDNERLGMEGFGAGNLPLAAPISGRLQSFRDFLRIVGNEFNIEELDKLPPPDWTVML